MPDSESQNRKTVMSIIDRINLFREELPRKCLYCQHGYPVAYGKDRFWDAIVCGKHSVEGLKSKKLTLNLTDINVLHQQYKAGRIYSPIVAPDESCPEYEPIKFGCRKFKLLDLFGFFDESGEQKAVYPEISNQPGEQISEPKIPDPEPGSVCVWTADENGKYNGSCGIQWSFIEGGISENFLSFCPWCGSRVVEQDGRVFEERNEDLIKVICDKCGKETEGEFVHIHSYFYSVSSDDELEPVSFRANGENLAFCYSCYSKFVQCEED